MPTSKSSSNNRIKHRNGKSNKFIDDFRVIFPLKHSFIGDFHGFPWISHCHQLIIQRFAGDWSFVQADCSSWAGSSNWADWPKWVSMPWEESNLG